VDQQGKVWGTTTTLFASPFFSVHLLRIDAGGFCSEHRHERKLNHFSVLAGTLSIHQWPGGDIGQDQPDRTALRAGDGLTIPVGVWHQFHAIEPTLCLEIYEAAPVEEDIIRRSQGGAPGQDPHEAGLP
jgi:mannose-6-phosphate isomerase-like protein (cupin superfamily)